MESGTGGRGASSIISGRRARHTWRDRGSPVSCLPKVRDAFDGGKDECVGVTLRTYQVWFHRRVP